jgi:hypothetical protein
LNQVGEGSDGAQDWVAGAALGPGVHTNAILLVFPDNRDVLGGVKVFGWIWYLTFVFATKGTAVEGNNFGLTGYGSLDLFARPHSEKETTDR